MTPIEEVKDTNVLIIGDSISIGYTLPTRELQGKDKFAPHSYQWRAHYKRFGRNRKVVGQQKMGSDSFNWGLHDLKYKDGTNLIPKEKVA